MAETYRAPKALQEQALTLDESPIVLKVRANESLTLADVVEIRDAWGNDWAKNIVDNVIRDLTQAYKTPKENRMAIAEGKPDLVEELTEALADVVSFYFRAHGAHWNVKGPDFSEYHALFAEIYEDVYGSIDPIAENLRKLGAPAPFQLAAFIALGELEDANVGSDARALAADLLSANEVVLNELNVVFTCATEMNQQGIANFIAERIDAHQKWKWQLSSSLGVDVALQSEPVMPVEDLDAATDWIAPDDLTRSAEETLIDTSTVDKMHDSIEERKSAIASAEKITMVAEVRSIDTNDGTMRIGGYAATFNKEADGLNFREVIAPGAFTRALASNDPVFLLVNHDMEGIPLASTQSGTLQLRQDKNGLYMEAELDPMNPRAQELASALKRGDMDKMSFAFTVDHEGQTRDNGLRTITQIERLYEVSVVTLPAYSSTTVGMRAAEAEDIEIARRKLALKFNQYSLQKNRKA